ncbi:FmdB family zinc ribbon protein [Nitratireductor pacificus]|uniref:Putative regulatory protein n=1 Tax=Nitratireductor pacificus pht-3B TaxID=391937 RepID=K2LHZ8_9HYPH|nr:FmdB family zinc ribbon protein [Nitratireductor pacificus]EKF17379.1 putative regulatory protein [Nitratireductor pacificus pht-3B]
MPLYNYVCDDCGPFDEWVSMAEATNACACPGCRAPSGRDIAAPHLSLMNGTLRKAHARSEKSGSEPRVVKREHLAGCGCSMCNLRKKPPSTRRKWMIGH